MYLSQIYEKIYNIKYDRYNMGMTLPALNGNWLDLVIIVFLLLSLWEGWERGFLLGIIDLLGFTFSFLFALKFYPLLGNFLVSEFSFLPGIANALSFLVIGIVFEVLLFSLLSYFIAKFFRREILSVWDRVLGIVPAVGQTLVIATFILTLLIALPVSPGFKRDVLNSKIGANLIAQGQRFERQLKSVFGEAANETLTFLTIKPGSQERTDLHFTQKDLKIDEVAESKMISLINGERARVGLSLLEVDPRLTEVAQAHSRDMFTRGYFSHYTPEGLSPFDRLTQAEISFTVAGENLAYAPNIDIAHTGLMNSPGHRANILSADYHKIGIGIIDGGIYGEMFSQEFTN